MIALARSLVAEAHLPAGSFSAVHDETQAAGLRRLRQSDAALLLATLPFFLAHEQQLRLTARLSAVPSDRDALEQWTLVAAECLCTRSVTRRRCICCRLASIFP